MRGLLIALSLLLWGCGGATSTVGPVAPEKALRGPLALQVLLVDYADTPCPYGEAEAWECVRVLNAFTVRNSGGVAWVVATVGRIALPLPAAAYGGVYGEVPELTRALLMDSRRNAPPSRFTVFLLPGWPAVFFGAGRPDWSEGYAWLSCVTAPSAMPLCHELGHALGLEHREGGVMSGTDPAAQVDAEGWFDPASRALLGWR